MVIPFEVCPLCTEADDVQRGQLPDGSLEYICPNARRHPDGKPFRWFPKKATGHLGEAEGLAAELGLYDDLVACLQPGAPWIEYGIVEHRFRENKPEKWNLLLRRYGHKRDGAKKFYTASAFLAFHLGWLRDHEEVVSTSGRATGFWSYNGTIWYWALPPGPPESERLTYEQFALEHGIDPNA